MNSWAQSEGFAGLGYATRKAGVFVGPIANKHGEEGMAKIAEALGLGPVSFLPPRSSTALPHVGPNTRLLLAQPFLGEMAKALERRGAKHLMAPFPLGEEGTTAWLKAAADAFGIEPGRFAAITGPGRARAKLAVEKSRPTLDGKRIFFFPDSQLEPAMARFLHRELGCDIVEIGTPFLHRHHLAGEFELLPDNVFV
eukprot:gene43957-59535_t